MEARSVGAPLPYVKRLIFSCLLPGLRPVLIATQHKECEQKRIIKEFIYECIRANC